MRMANSTPRPLVPAVDRAARTLRLLASQPDGRALSDLARDLDVSKASLREILLTLGRYGLVQRDANLKFSLGPEVARLARTTPGDLVSRALPILRTLAAEFGETVMLGVPEPPHLRLAAVAEPVATLHVAARQGGHIPLDAGCHGKVLVDHERVGIDDEEFVEGVRAVAVPVAGDDGKPIGCLMLAGFKRKLSIARLRRVGARLERESARLSGFSSKRNGARR